MRMPRAQDKRIAFADDISDGKDVTDMVKAMRNASCHVKSGRRKPFAGQFEFGYIVLPPSKNFHFIWVMDSKDSSKNVKFNPENPYTDDIAFYIGPHRLFLKRHIRRSVAEAKNAISEMKASI